MRLSSLSPRLPIGGPEEFADVCQEALAIVMAAVGPQGKSGVPQVAQVAHDLATGGAAKVGLVHDCFFQLGVGDLALRHGSGDAKRTGALLYSMHLKVWRGGRRTMTHDVVQVR
jgi:hypothetical protein